MTLRQDLGGETRPYHKIKPKTIRSRLRVCNYVANSTVVPERLTHFTKFLEILKELGCSKIWNDDLWFNLRCKPRDQSFNKLPCKLPNKLPNKLPCKLPNKLPFTYMSEKTPQLTETRSCWVLLLIRSFFAELFFLGGFDQTYQ